MTEKEKVFNKIATEEAQRQGDNIGNFEYYSYYLCPDQYVGLIKDFKEDDKKTKDDFPVRYNIGVVENILILILESPHRDEFYAEAVKDENGTVIHHKGDPIGPANGPTGRNIRKYIAEIFPDFSNYHLCLMNAIPFQCSLGVGTEHFRYDVFQNAWADKHIGAEFCKKRLTDFLNALSRKNIVIVNACTKGYNAAKDSDQRPFLWHLVQNSIETLTLGKEKTIQYFRINHPSSWARNKKNREIKDHRQITFPKTKK